MPTHPPDEIIHQLLRLRIMAAIYAGRRSLPLEFTDLKRIAQATDGNLGSHLSTLEKAGYVAIAKDPAQGRAAGQSAAGAAGSLARIRVTQSGCVAVLSLAGSQAGARRAP